MLINIIEKRVNHFQDATMKGDPDLVPIDKLKQIGQECGFDFLIERVSKMGFTLIFIKPAQSTSNN